MSDSYDTYWTGEKLFGDDFSGSQIRDWFDDEQNAYHELDEGYQAQLLYAFHALNWYHGFRFISGLRFQRALGFGSSYGSEFFPIAAQIDAITLIEPSPQCSTTSVGGTAVEVVRPRPSGSFRFANNTFDLIVCLSALHHVANVSTVIGEMARTSKPGAYLLIREPVVSMGDWRKPRKGLTRRERGIPIKVFRGMIADAGLVVQREAACQFSLTSRVTRVLGSPVYNSPFWTRVDALLCSLPFWPNRYHPRFFLHKLRPWSVSYVLRKPEIPVAA